MKTLTREDQEAITPVMALNLLEEGLGDILSIRIAGNVINEDILGSMEFGCRTQV